MRTKVKISYFLFGESFSGIINGQVVDLVKVFQLRRLECEFGIIAFFSIRRFRHDRKSLKKVFPKAVCLPAVPGIKNWLLNVLFWRLLQLFLNLDIVVCRGPQAAALVIHDREKNASISPFIVYDGRGARSAEIEEYSKSHRLKDEMVTIEMSAVLKSDFRLAVSQKLVDYWSEKFGYVPHPLKQQVVPCTMASVVDRPIEFHSVKRDCFGWTDQDIVFVFTGGSSDWQHSRLFSDFCMWILSKKDCRLLFLCKDNQLVERCIQKNPSSVRQIWVSFDEVSDWMAIGDYGILLRNCDQTNRVAAPVKFAEYLSCGLKVICSHNLGDYSEFVCSHGAGHVVGSLREAASISFERIQIAEKMRLKEIAHHFFSKDSPIVMEHYDRMFEVLLNSKINPGNIKIDAV